MPASVSGRTPQRLIEKPAYHGALFDPPTFAVTSQASSAAAPRYAVPALEKTLDILEYLSEQAIPMTQAQLARALGRQPGELFRILAYLEQRGYLYRDPASAAYSLTLKLFELSRQHSPYDALLQVALPWMQRLTNHVREPCHLSVLHHDKLLVLAQSESPDPFRLSVQIGSLHSPVNRFFQLAVTQRPIPVGKGFVAVGIGVGFQLEHAAIVAHRQLTVKCIRVQPFGLAH